MFRFGFQEIFQGIFRSPLLNIHSFDLPLSMLIHFNFICVQYCNWHCREAYDSWLSLDNIKKFQYNYTSSESVISDLIRSTFRSLRCFRCVISLGPQVNQNPIKGAAFSFLFARRKVNLGDGGGWWDSKTIWEGPMIALESVLRSRRDEKPPSTAVKSLRHRLCTTFCAKKFHLEPTYRGKDVESENKSHIYKMVNTCHVFVKR